MLLTLTFRAAVLGLLLVVCSYSHAAPGPAESPIVFKFVTVGDSRQQPKRAGNTAQDERWLQATSVWSRMLTEIERQKPNALIFNGDMIYGYTLDMAVIDRQYAFWRGMVAGLMERGTYVLPVPGNHEVQVPLPKPDGSSVKTALVAQENAWRDNMGDLILDLPLWKKTAGLDASAWRIENTPAAGADGITTDQRQLSYSFDSGAIHIAVINTDPVGFDESAPVAWLAQDLAAAKSRGAKNFFVFGHKPAYTYIPESISGNAKKKAAAEDGLGSRGELREKFWDVVETYGATYFCGHQHVYHASQPRKSAGGRAWQVIVGTAGSPLTMKAADSGDPIDGLYAWAEVSVRHDGTANVIVRGFDDAKGNVINIDHWTLPTK